MTDTCHKDWNLCKTHFNTLSIMVNFSVLNETVMLNQD